MDAVCILLLSILTCLSSYPAVPGVIRALRGYRSADTAGYPKLPGDRTDGETPDPIPNSEAKTVRPMVVLRGESR